MFSTARITSYRPAGFIRRQSFTVAWSTVGQNIRAPAAELRDRIDSPLGPRITAHQPRTCQNKTLRRPMPPHCPDTIARTTRVIAATGRRQWADQLLVTPEDDQQGHPERPTSPPEQSSDPTLTRHASTAPLLSSCVNSARIAGPVRVAAPGRARITMSWSTNSPSRGRTVSRICREIRCRCTEFPTLPPTTSPTRAGPGSPLRYIWKYRTRTRCLERNVARKSFASLRRCCLGSIHQALTRSRPFRRREFTIERPARVRIRSRKPCLRERRLLLG